MMTQQQTSSPHYDLRQRNKRQQRPPSARPRDAVQYLPLAQIIICEFLSCCSLKF